MHHFAQVVGVARPTVYAWREGTVDPRTQHLQRLKELADVAREWQSFRVGPMGSQLATPLEDGRSILDLLSEKVWDRRALSAAMETIRDAQLRTQERKRSRKYQSVADALAEAGHHDLEVDRDDNRLRMEERRLHGLG